MQKSGQNRATDPESSMPWRERDADLQDFTGSLNTVSPPAIPRAHSLRHPPHLHRACLTCCSLRLRAESFSAATEGEREEAQPKKEQPKEKVAPIFPRPFADIARVLPHHHGHHLHTQAFCYKQSRRSQRREWHAYLLDHLHPHQDHGFHPHQLLHPWQRSLDVGWNSGRLRLGFSAALESDSVDAEKKEPGLFSNFTSYDAKCSIDLREEPIASNHACAGRLITAGVDLPLSLRMLKKKQQGVGKSTSPSGLSEAGNSLLNAFSSVVHMMKALQSHTLRIRREVFAQEVEGLLSQVHQEMHASFVWLFQQVFSCTPELMVIVMVFLADFTAFSMASNIPLLPISKFAPPVSIVSTLSNAVNSTDEGLRAYLSKFFEASPYLVDKADGTCSDGGYVGNGGKGVYQVKGGDNEDPDFLNASMNLNKAPYAVDDNLSTELSSEAAVSVSSLHKSLKSQAGLPDDFMSITEDVMPLEFSDMAAELAFQELITGETPSPGNSHDMGQYVEVVNDAEAAETKDVAGTYSHLTLGQGTIRSLVAPVSAQVEDDDYSCYDKTDLAYQVAINKDSKNPMLLANYAHFLFLVRKDHDRAEALFQKAVQCDPFDCDAISRFASFLWLARHNLVGAEKAFQAALRVDPNNSFHAANYAHFLWNSGR